MKFFSLSFKIILPVLLVVGFAFLYVNIANARIPTRIDELAGEFDKMFSGNFSEIINNISTEASSGGNTAGSGEVVKGKAIASTSVKTIINGQVVEDYSIKKETENGRVEVDIKSEINTDKDKAIVETTTVVNGEESVWTSEVKLNEKPSEEKINKAENPSKFKSVTPEKTKAQEDKNSVLSSPNSCGLSIEDICDEEIALKNSKAQEKPGLNLLALAWKSFLDFFVGGVIKIAGVFS